MSKLSPEPLAQEWQQLLERFPLAVGEHLQRIATTHQVVLAAYFYEQMLQDPHATQFLSHDQVKTRLGASMERWLVGVFSTRDAHGLQALIAQQVRIGEVHARIDVPVHLVLRGARNLKDKLNQLLHEDPLMDPAQTAQASRLAFDLIDMAMEIMSQAYANLHDRHSRAEEAYRLFSVAQNVGTEREKQRAALLDWENQLMFEQAVGQVAGHLPKISGSEFGLWFRHKGAHAFQGSGETDLIMDAMDHIDHVLLPTFDLPENASQAQRVQRLRDLRERTKAIAYHLDALFEQNNELESGRDVLTRLLNRKFLPVVLSKEVVYARKRQATFAVLAIDIDHFKRVNDSHGHEAGDMVLQQLSAILSNGSRAGDYTFRLGGEEFLMLLVDVKQDSALTIAEKLRKIVEREPFRLPLDQRLNLTISIGVALHNGHPDYQLTIRQADEALYRAKHQGRNCVVLASQD